MRFTPLVLVACASATRAQTPDTAGAVADSIRALDRAWMVDASLRHDARALERYLAPEFTLVFRNGGLYDRAHELAAARRGPPEPPSVRYAVSEQRVRVYGAAAVTTGLFVASQDGRAGPPARYTHTYVRRAGAWTIVASQFTTVPRAPG
jgi:ketosteroid isomerase-like protein